MGAGRKALAGLALATAAIWAIPAQVLAAAKPTWHIVYEVPDRQTVLDGVTAAGKNDAWAFGRTFYGPRYSKQKAALFRWNGRHWRPVAVPAPAGFLPGTVRDFSPQNVWIIGVVASLRGSYPLALHLAGRTWHQLAMPYYADYVGALVMSSTDIWTTGGPSCTVAATQVCTTPVYHWNGAAWSAATLTGDIQALTGSGTHVWAAGYNDLRTKVLKRTKHGSTEQITGGLTLLQLSQGTWLPATSAHPRITDPGGVPFAAAGPSGKVWVVTGSSASGRYTLRYWNGQRWADQLVPPYGDGPDTNASYLTYENGEGVWAGAYLRWTGRRWVSAPVTPAGNRAFVQHLGAIPGAKAVWGVGDQNSRFLIAAYPARP